MADKLKLGNSEKHYQRALELIPGAVLGIRRPYNFVPGEYPIFFDSAKGGRVIDVDGNEYIDMLCAYGPIIIGHREEEIDDAVIAQIKGKGFCFSLTQKWQNLLAERMKELIPCCEKTVFVKTGSDATTAAVRIARAYTERLKIVRCGYHGWHDWCVEVKGGIPEKLYEDVHEVEYNDLDELEDLLKKIGDQTAAIMVTPLGHPLAKNVEYPKPGYLQGVQDLARKYGIVLIFDEIRTGFRVSMGGAQKEFGVTPDLAVFGKAMANGYAIGSVVGKKEIMDVLIDKVFLSSTFFPNSLEQVAALKTIEFMEKNDVINVVKAKGEKFAQDVGAIVEKSSIPAEFSGAPWMPFITFQADPEKRYRLYRNEFYTQLIRMGVFLQPYHHGYIAFRHTEEDLNQAVNAIAEAFRHIESL
jgi:3-aminobutanoyl-CoA transaminase